MQGRVARLEASKASRPAPSLSLWLVRFAFFSILVLRGDPSDSPRSAPFDLAQDALRPPLTLLALADDEASVR